jgi:hypothetical protein
MFKDEIEKIIKKTLKKKEPSQPGSSFQICDPSHEMIISK